MAVVVALAAALLPGAAATLPRRRLVAGAHPLLEARFSETGELTAADFAAAAEAAAPADARRAAPRPRAVGRLGSVSYDVDDAACDAYTSTTACYDGDASSIGDDMVRATAPGACASCGYAEVQSGAYHDCLTCADAAHDIVVLFDDCTGLCADGDGVAFYESLGFATFDESACTLYANCYDSFVDAETGGTNAMYIAGDDDGASYSYSYVSAAPTVTEAPTALPYTLAGVAPPSGGSENSGTKGTATSPTRCPGRRATPPSTTR